MTSYDLVIVGAGIVGLAHAADAVSRGRSVCVVERDERAAGASVRNFGHVGATAQSGPALDYALSSCERWIDLGRKAGFEVLETGTVLLARSAAELAVLEEFADARGPEHVRLVGRDRLAELSGELPVADPDLVGAAHFPLDVRVDPRAAVPALAAWLVEEGVDIRYDTHVGSVEETARGARLHTSRGTVDAGAVVHAVGHDVDRLFPDVAAAAAMERCHLVMLEVAAPGGLRIPSAILTGTSMLRYAGLAAMPSAATVRAEIAARRPELLDAAVNLMLTQRPDGALVLGDTHHYARTPTPFDEESLAELVLREGGRLLGADLRVLRRWRGVYANAPTSDFLVASPFPAVRVVSVTSGIGMTTALGLAPAVLDDLL